MSEPHDIENPGDPGRAEIGEVAAASGDADEVRIQESGTEKAIAALDSDSTNGIRETLCITFRNCEPELKQAADVVDEQGRTRSHRSFQVLGVFLLLWMFGPNILKNPADIMSWFMVLAAVGLLWLVLKYPERINLRFAKERAESIPECTIEVTNEGITVIEGPSRYEIDFGDKVAAYDYRDVITLVSGSNRILSIPKKQLSDADMFSLRAALRHGLGDRFKTIEYKPSQGLFGRTKLG